MNTKDVELNDVSLIIATYNEEESLGYVLDEIKDLNVRANAETALDASVAIKFGAVGIGLCRTR